MQKVKFMGWSLLFILGVQLFDSFISIWLNTLIQLRFNQQIFILYIIFFIELILGLNLIIKLQKCFYFNKEININLRIFFIFLYEIHKKFIFLIRFKPKRP